MRKLYFAALWPILLLSLCSCASESPGEVSFMVGDAERTYAADSAVYTADPAGGHPTPVSAGTDKEGETAADEPETAGSVAAVTAPVAPDIVVHVCGAVADPGVYTLAAGSRVCQAVEAAGGFGPDADEAYVNQAQILEDGVRLRIPTCEETAALALQGPDQVVPEVVSMTGAAAASTGSGASGGLVNINTADAETLCTLNGIGPGTAAKIIQYREKQGAFSRIEDIMQVSGIKEKLFAKIRDSITV